MMLAQSDAISGGWAAFYAAIVLILQHIGKWVSDIRKDRREIATDVAKQNTLNRIADSNDAQKQLLTVVVGELGKAHSVGKIRQDMIKTWIDGSCKAECKEPRKLHIKPKIIPE